MGRRELEELQLSHRANFSPVLEATRNFEDTVARSVSQTLRAAQEAARITFTPPEIMAGKQAAAAIAKATAAARSIRASDFRSPLQDLISRLAAQDRAMMELMQTTVAYGRRTLEGIQVEALERRTYSQHYGDQPASTPGPSNGITSGPEISASSAGIVVHQSSNVNINVTGTVAGRGCHRSGTSARAVSI